MSLNNITGFVSHPIVSPGKARPGTEVIKLIVLNSVEHDIYPAHKC